MELTDKLNNFFNGMRYHLDVARQARQSVAAEIADSFSVFDYIRLDENRLSKIIADLLDPRGSHGQGSMFLKLFLEQLPADRTLPLNWKELAEKANVFTEFPAVNKEKRFRRIDILIQLSPSFGIGIENKPWAKEQADQLADYHIALVNRYKESVLIFLSQRGRAPASIPHWESLQSEGKAATFSYPDEFLVWVMECSRWCQADKVRHFLRDLASYVQSELNQTYTEGQIDA